MSSASGSDFLSAIKSRTRILCIFFTIWFLAAALRAWFIAGPGRDGFIAAGEQAARRTFYIPARRGRILDANGVRLVWSERFYDLVSTCPNGDALSGDEIRMLKTAAPEIAATGGVLFRGLDPGGLERLEEPLRSGVRARIVVRDERIVVDSPAIRLLAGKVVSHDGGWSGASGWEKEYDAQLAGTPGKFTVMLDRHRNWIASTVKMMELPEAGRDVRIAFSLRELEAGMEAGR